VIEPILQADRLLRVGLLDQAEALYRQTAERDPGNAFAVLGLARVAVERGDERAAYGYARQALLLDPAHWSAHALEVRLRELLVSRGESLPDPPHPVAEGPGPGAAVRPRRLLRRVLGR
jgi:tetratricopeptide (TPR) repeat protein